MKLVLFLILSIITNIGLAKTYPSSELLESNVLSTNEIELVWTDTTRKPNEKWYEVQSSKTPDFIDSTVYKVSANKTTYKVSNLLPGQNYCFKVKAFHNSRESEFSNMLCDITKNDIPVLEKTFVSRGYVSGSAVRTKGRMADNSKMNAHLYAETSKQRVLYLWDKDGNTSHVAIEGLEDDKIENMEYVLTENNTLYLFSTNGSNFINVPLDVPTLRTYKLSGVGILPTVATLTDVKKFGDIESVSWSILELKSGGIALLWNRVNPDKILGEIEGRWAHTYLEYLSPLNVWSTLYVGQMDYLKPPTHRLTMAQHPADDSIWVFNKSDSFHELGAARVIETSNGLQLDWLNQMFIGQQHGRFNVEGELPQVFAVSNKYKNTISLLYQADDSIYHYSSPFRKESRMIIAEISSNSDINFIDTERYTERVYGIGALTVYPDGYYVTYRPTKIKDNPPDYRTWWDDVHVIRYNGIKWEHDMYVGTTYFGTISTPVPIVQYSTNEMNIILSEYNAEIYLYNIQ